MPEACYAIALSLHPSLPQKEHMAEDATYHRPEAHCPCPCLTPMVHRT